MTGLVYATIILLWAVVLVPRWLRRHDENRQSQAEALESVLGGASGPSGSSSDSGSRALTAGWGHQLRQVLPGHRTASSSDAPEARGDTAVPGRRAVDAATLRVRASARAKARTRRRRTVLAVLATAVLGSVAGVMAGLLPGIVMVGAVVLLVTYLAAMVILAQRHSENPDNAQGAMAASEQEAPVPTSVQQSPAQAVDGVRVVVRTEQWDAREATLPTYVNKPKASKVPRRIDLASGWTGADMVARARDQQDVRASYEREWSQVEPDPGSEEQVARWADGDDQAARYLPRAVNE